MSLKKSALKGVKWTSLSSIVISVTQLLQIIILTKFLQPTDFGLMAIILFVINFSQTFIDLGISNAIIFKQNINGNQLSTLYILNVIIGIFLFVVLYLLSPFIAGFYNDYRLEDLIRIVASVFLIIPFGQQFQVLLKKDLRFKSIAVRDVIARILSLVFTVVLAYMGFGVFSLVYGNLFYNTLSTILLIAVGYKYHKPKLYFKLSEVSFLFSFGFYQMGEKIVNFLNKEIDTLIIGKLLGMEVLGLYNVAKDFISKPYQLINPILTKVSFPVMAKIQDDLVRIKKVYLQTIELLSIVNTIIFVFCFFFSKEIILLFFGEKWLEASVVLSILSIYMLIRSIGNPVGSLQLALGRADLGFYWNLLILLLIPITVYLGSFWGLIGVSISLVVCQVVLYVPSWKLMVNRLVPISLKEYNATQYPYFIFALISCFVSYLLVLAVDNNLLRFLIGGCVSILIYFLLFFKFKKSQFASIKSLITK